jgi:hypothetical protein
VLYKYAKKNHNLFTNRVFEIHSAADGKGTNLFGTLELIVLHSEGMINWAPRVCLEALCSLDLHLWPFDRHTCVFTVGTWAQEGLINISTTHSVSEI